MACPAFSERPAVTSIIKSYVPFNHSTSSSPFKNGIPNLFSGHIGYSVTGGPGGGIEGRSPLVLDKYWGGSGGVLPPPQAAVNQLPVARLASSVTTINPVMGQPSIFCILYTEIETNEGGNWVTSAEWSEFHVPYNVPFNAQLFDDNDNGIPDFVFDAKFMFSPTEIPLDDLGSIYEDPDSPGSGFSSMAVPSPQVLIPGMFDGQMIPDGGNTSAQLIYSPMPEPTAFATMAIAAAGLLLRRRSNRQIGTAANLRNIANSVCL